MVPRLLPDVFTFDEQLLVDGYKTKSFENAIGISVEFFAASKDHLQDLGRKDPRERISWVASMAN